jgi:hypothetical protein
VSHRAERLSIRLSGRARICTYLSAMRNPLEAAVVEALTQRGVRVPSNELAELTRAYQTLLDLERVLETMLTRTTEPAFIALEESP